MKHLFTLTFVSLALAACNNTAPDNSLKYIPAEASVTAEATYIPLKDIAKKINYIPLETTPESLIKNITGFVLDGNTIYVNNAGDGCLKFTSEGKFAGAVGLKGRGPNEYLNIGEIFLQEGKVHIYDNYSNSILTHDPSGTFLSRVKLDGYLANHTSAELLPSGELITFTPDQGPAPKTAMLTFASFQAGTADAIRLTDSIPHINPIPERVDINWYFKEGQFVRNGEKLLFKCTFNDTIYRIEQQQGKHTLQPQYIFQLGRYAAIPDARVEAQRAFNSFQAITVFKIMQKIELLGETDRYLFYSDIDRKEPCYFYDKKANVVNKWRLIPDGKEAECKENADYYTPWRIDANGNLLGVMQPENENDNPVLVIAKLKD